MDRLYPIPSGSEHSRCHRVIEVGSRGRVLRRRCGGIGGRRFEEFTAVSALLGFRQNFLSTEGAPFCWLCQNRRCWGYLSFRFPSPHGFQFRIGVDNVLLGACRSVYRVPAIGADLGVFADATCAFWAFSASGESQCKSDGAKQDSEAEPQTAVCTPVAGNNGGTDAEQEPDYEKFHNVVFITLCGPIVRVPVTDAAGPSGGLTACGWYGGTMPLVTGSKDHLTLYGSYHPKPNEYGDFKVVTLSTGFTRGFQR